MILNLHQGENVTRNKIWRFNVDFIDEYTIHRVMQEFLEIYPDVRAKGLEFKMHYIDSFGGKIHIESDTDFKSALRSFHDEDSTEKQYLTLHLEEKLKRSVESRKDSSQTKGKHKKATSGDLDDQPNTTARTQSTKVNARTHSIYLY